MPGPDGITLDFSEFNASLAAFNQRFPAEAGIMVRQVGHALISAAQKRTPVLTGFLQNSGIVVEVGKPLAVEIGFNATYAAAVHERLELTHTQGQSKFLESALREDGPEILRLQSAEFARRLGVS